MSSSHFNICVEPIEKTNEPATSPLDQSSIPAIRSTPAPQSTPLLSRRESIMGSQSKRHSSFRLLPLLVSQVIRRQIRPQKKLGKSPTFMSSLRAIVCKTYLNILFIFIPIGWTLHFHRRDDYPAVFITNFLAIVPLAKLLGFATDELSIRIGPAPAALLHVTFGNAVELIVAIAALTKCELRVVQLALTGSILSNILLVLGLCFIAGGMRYSEQGFMTIAIQLNILLLSVSVTAMFLPVLFHFIANQQNNLDEGRDILRMSHGIAVILLLIYTGYVSFQLSTHAHLYDGGEFSGYAEASTSYPTNNRSLKGIAMSTTRRRKSDEEQPVDFYEEEEVMKPALNVATAIALIMVISTLVLFSAEYLVDSIDGLTEGGSISKEFIGVILLPIVTNIAEAAEQVAIIRDGARDRLDRSISVTLGSGIQIALFVIPLLILIARGMGKPLTLLNDPLETIVLFLSVQVLSQVISNGKSHWLKGFILIMLYTIVAIVFWHYPGSNPLAEMGPSIDLGGCSLEASS